MAGWFGKGGKVDTFLSSHPLTKGLYNQGKSIENGLKQGVQNLKDTAPETVRNKELYSEAQVNDNLHKTGSTSKSVRDVNKELVKNDEDMKNAVGTEVDSDKLDKAVNEREEIKASTSDVTNGAHYSETDENGWRKNLDTGKWEADPNTSQKYLDETVDEMPPEIKTAKDENEVFELVDRFVNNNDPDTVNAELKRQMDSLEELKAHFTQPGMFESATASGKLGILATVASAMFSALTGAPFVNFNNFLGTKERFEEKMKNFTAAYNKYLEEYGSKVFGAEGEKDANKTLADQDEDTVNQSARNQNAKEKDLKRFEVDQDMKKYAANAKVDTDKAIAIYRANTDDDIRKALKEAGVPAAEMEATFNTIKNLKSVNSDWKDMVNAMAMYKWAESGKTAGDKRLEQIDKATGSVKNVLNGAGSLIHGGE